MLFLFHTKLCFYLIGKSMKALRSKLSFLINRLSFFGMTYSQNSMLKTDLRKSKQSLP